MPILQSKPLFTAVATAGITLAGLLACQNNGANAQDVLNAGSADAVFGSGLRALEDRSETSAPLHTLGQRMAESNTPGVAVALIRNGKLAWAKGFGTRSADDAFPVDENTVFSAGSVSKLVNAALILRLVQAGQLDLDTDVNAYLSSWKVPDAPPGAASKVTLRQILAHTAGFSQHGFADFEPGESLPTVLQTLNGEQPAKHDPVELLFEPGSAMKYSGGGVTVSQLIVTEVTGRSYEAAAKEYVFDPLEMQRSTFANPLPAAHGNIAYAHDRTGERAALPRGYEAMPEMAASGLWTSAADLAKFVRAILGDSDFLIDDLREQMLTRQKHSWHGLGPRINGAGEKSVFHHGGSNNSYQTWVEGHPDSGDGLVVLTNSAGGRVLAYEIRLAIERELGWPIAFPDDFDEPGTS